jgi:hypothetical protein
MNPDFFSTLTPTQLAGVGILALLAYREKTDLSYQQQEWGFWDIPEEVIESLDTPGYYNQDHALVVANTAITVLTTLNAAIVAPTAK